MSAADKRVIRQALPGWMYAKGWSWVHTVKVLRMRQRLGLFV